MIVLGRDGSFLSSWGRDLFTRIVYGFRVSMTFALICLGLEVVVGILFGAIQGFLGGMVDLLGQRLTEVVVATGKIQPVTLVADNVLVLTSELHDRTIEIIRRNDNHRVSFFICGDLNFELAASPVHKFYDWFTTTVHFYKYVRPETLDVLHPYNTKENYFDIYSTQKIPIC